MPSVLHVLPHAGGGGETYIDLLEGIEGYTHERVRLAAGRTLAGAAVSIPRGYPDVVARARRADVVHAHGDVASVLSLPFLRSRPSVWTTHGLHLLRRLRGPARTGLEGALRQVVRATAVTICTSETERGELRSVAGSAVAKLRTIRNGIDPPAPPTTEQREAARAALGLTPQELAVLFLGELEERKRPLIAVAAAERARAAGAEVTLLVAGDGPQAIAVGERGGPFVHVLGFRSDVSVLLAGSDVLVMPSEREGLSFGVLEAMGAGMVLIVSDGPGNPEAIGSAGIVTPLDDVERLAGALTRLAADRCELARLGEAARERVLTELTLDRLRAGVRAAYDQALRFP